MAEDDEEQNLLKQVPEGAELWQVGDAQYLIYRAPGPGETILHWRVEDPARVEAIWGEDKAPDRVIEDPAEFLAMQPWYGGLTSDLREMEGDPWQQFSDDYFQALATRPWMADPTMIATVATAYLEGRDPTRDELAKTDWWKNHTADERAWLETSVTAGQAEVERMRQDMRLQIDQSLRGAGVDTTNNPNLVDYIADKRLTGQWSEAYTVTQIRRLADPMAGSLDPEFEKVVAGEYFRPDATREAEQEVRQLASEWLGPTMGNMSIDEQRRWAGRIRNDPDAKDEFVRTLQQQRFAMFPQYENINLTYDQIVSPFRNLANNVWGQPITDDSLLVDLVNTGDFTEAQRRLRKKGLDMGVQKVVNDALNELRSTSLGEQVVRSAI